MSSERTALSHELTQLAKDGQTNLGKRQRQKAARGLPDQATLMEMAATYLEIQVAAWPDLVKQKLLPKKGAENLEQMAAAFERRFRTGELDEFEAETAAAIWKALAAERAVIGHHLRHLLRPSNTTLELRRYDQIDHDQMEVRFRASTMAPP